MKNKTKEISPGRMKKYPELTSTGKITINQIRNEFGMEPIPYGNIKFISKDESYTQKLF